MWILRQSVAYIHWFRAGHSDVRRLACRFVITTVAEHIVPPGKCLSADIAGEPSFSMTCPLVSSEVGTVREGAFALVARVPGIHFLGTHFISMY